MKQSCRLPIYAMFIGIFTFLGSAPHAFGITITVPAVANHVHQLPATDADDMVSLNPDPITYLKGATAAMKVALAADFPTWIFRYNAGLKGTLNLDRYKATTEGDDNGGGLIEATYTRAATDPAIADLHWIQMVVTNQPLGGGPNTGYIDPRPNDDTLPFYWTLAEDNDINSGNKTAATYSFFDNSMRNDLTDPDLVIWRGDLMLASWDDPGIVTVYDGIQWGWDLVDTVPEPSSLLLLLIGGFCVGIERAVSKKRQQNSITN